MKTIERLNPDVLLETIGIENYRIDYLGMPAQHKRPGRTARLERIRRVKEREEVKKRYREQVVVLLPTGRQKYDGFLGRIMAVGIPPGMSA